MSDIGSWVAKMLAVLVVAAICIRLIPVLFHVVWQLLPAILVLWLILAALRAMVDKLRG